MALLAPSGSLLAGDVVFRWTRSPGAIEYQVYIQRNGSKLADFHPEEFNGGISAYELTFIDLPSGSYQYWVRARSAGGYSARAGPLMFSLSP